MPNLNFIIRNATENDIDAVYQIETQSSARWKKHFFETELETTFAIFIIAEYNGKIIGYAIAWNIKGEIQLNNIAVSPSFRRKGIASKLLQYIINLLEDEGAHKIYLEVMETNTVGRIFYKNFGFFENGKRHNYYQDSHAILMEMKIGQNLNEN